jgi:NADH dehydrogenase FAD-containing subunit
LSTSGEKHAVVFAGGEHAQLYSLRRTRELTERGFEVVLVNSGRFLYYSGMAPGLLSGTYGAEEARIDVAYLAKKGEVRFVEDRVEESPRDGEVLLAGGCSVRYEAMSSLSAARSQLKVSPRRRMSSR